MSLFLNSANQSDNKRHQQAELFLLLLNILLTKVFEVFLTNYSIGNLLMSVGRVAMEYIYSVRFMASMVYRRNHHGGFSGYCCAFRVVCLNHLIPRP